MKTIAIINLKGGVGKTTTAINMAALLAGRHDKSVLFVDNDPQGNASQFFDCYESWSGICGAAEILNGVQPGRYFRSVGAGDNQSGIEIINANISLLEADNALRASTERQDNRIRTFLSSESVQHYDYCIIDNPPALLMCTINALCAADEVIIPVTLDNWSLDGVETITEQIEQLKVLNDKLTIAGILLTNYKKSPENEAAEKWLRENCKYKVFDTQIRRSDKATAAAGQTCRRKGGNMFTLTLKKKWFDMELSGEKPEEYREIKPYWEVRLRKLFGENGIGGVTKKN